MASSSIGPGTVLAGRYRLDDLLSETDGARFWRATDRILARSVAVNVLDADDRRADAMLLAARTSATVTDGHFLRVLDADSEDLDAGRVTYVVNEWGSGVSLDRLLADGPLPPRRAAWLVKEVADAVVTAHRHGIAHGRLLPEHVMVNEAGSVKLIGFVVASVLSGRHGPLVPGGEPLSDHESDVVNLAALLYAALVGRWAGSAGSSLPPAPRDNGRPLRPRQVRAGVPRPLDAICDRVLNGDNHQSSVPISTAFEIWAALGDFVGDPTASAYAEPEQTAVIDVHAAAQATHSQPRPGESDDPSPQDLEATRTVAPVDAPVDEPEAEPDTRPERTDAESADEQTQAGAPVFFDDDTGVGWAGPGDRAARGDQSSPRSGTQSPAAHSPAHSPAQPPPPPPPAPDPKPLFAPDPPRGPRTRRGTARSTGASAPGPAPVAPPGWPWAPEEPPAPVPPDTREPDGGDDRGGSGGRRWLRVLAVIVVLCALVAAVILAFNLGRGSGGGPPDRGAASPSTSGTSPVPSSGPVPVVAADDFDPLADPAEENPDLVGQAVDDDPATAWETVTYFNDPELGGLKDGVGLVVDLGSPERVSEVELLLQGSPTTLELYAADEGAAAPTSLDELSQVGGAENAGEQVTVELDQAVVTQYLVVWLTSLPPAEGGFVGSIADIAVRS